MELILVILGVAGGLVLLVIGIMGSRRSSQKLVEERLGKLSTRADEAMMDVPRQRRSPLGDSLNRALAGRGFAQNLQTQLARADLKFTVGEFMATTAIAIIGVGALVFLISKSSVFAALGAVGGFFIPRIYVSILQGRRLKMFNNQLSDTINLLVNSLRSGYSVLQAMEAVSREMPKPISAEFGRVVQEVQLGLTIEQALNNMLRRVTSADLDLMVTAIIIQREVGGNLAEILDVISHTIRERVRIKGEIAALTAQGRWSGYLISGLPVVLSILIFLINPNFMGLMFEHKCGWIMIGVAVAGIVAGFFTIQKIVDIEV